LGVPAKRRILIADVPDAHNAIAECLPGRELHFADTLEGAKLELIQRPFNLVIIGLRFDESRMFLLLDYLRSNSRYGDVPVVCVQSRPSLLPRELRGTIEEAMKLLGAGGFIAMDGRNHKEVCRYLADAAEGRIPRRFAGQLQKRPGLSL
jgi:hypothetical protein